MTITFGAVLNTDVFQTTTTGSGTTLDLTGGDWAAGDVVVLMVNWENVGSTVSASCTDGSFTNHAVAGAGDPWSSILTRKMTGAATDQTITATFDGSGDSNFKDITAFVVNGNFDASYFDGVGTYTSAATNVTTGTTSSFGTTSSGMIIVGAKAYNSVTWTPQSGLTAVTGASAFQGLAYTIAAAAGPRTVQMDTSGSTRLRIVGIALKEADGGGSSNPARNLSLLGVG